MLNKSRLPIEHLFSCHFFTIVARNSAVALVYSRHLMNNHKSWKNIAWVRIAAAKSPPNKPFSSDRAVCVPLRPLKNTVFVEDVFGVADKLHGRFLSGERVEADNAFLQRRKERAYLAACGRVIDLFIVLSAWIQAQADRLRLGHRIDVRHELR